MRLLKAFFNAVKSAAKSIETDVLTAIKTIATTAKKVAIKVSKVAFKVLRTSLQLSLIIAVCCVTLLIIPMILPMILANTSNIEKEHSQAITMLPPRKAKPIKQQETIENGILITPISDEELLIQTFYELPIEQPKTEIEEVSETGKTQDKRDIKPLNNQLALKTISWQALYKVSEQLNKIKASELKSIASELHISKYRSMNKIQLLIAIMLVAS